jgi:uncharacterized protein DUF4261
MRLLTRLGALIEEPDQTYLAETNSDGTLKTLQAASCTYRIALGPRAGYKVLRLQSLSSIVRPSSAELRINAHAFSLHAAVRWRADQRKELEQPCPYLRPLLDTAKFRDRFHLYCAFVVLVGDSDNHHSCGMHHFELPECQVDSDTPVEGAADLMNRFNYYQILERPSLASGHTFSLTKDSPSYVLDLLKDTRHEEGDVFYNPTASGT